MTECLTRNTQPDNIILIYGGGGLGKSTLLNQLATYVWKRYGLKTRVVGADGGGTKPFKTLMDAGIIDYWPIDQWTPINGTFATLNLASKGWWPEDVKTPGSTLLPPTEITRPCPECDGDSGAKGPGMVKKCATCKVSFGNGVRLKPKMKLINGFDEVGHLSFEGVTAYGGLLLRALKELNPEGGHCLEEKDIDGDVVFKIAQLGMQHYGSAQNYLQQYIAHTRTVPVPFVTWTALELRGVDESGKPVFGPAFPGKALTAICIPWFTDVLHLEGEPIRDKDGVENVKRKLFLAKHYPQDSKPYGFTAKSSSPDGTGMPLVIDAISGRNNMEVYFKELEKAFAKEKEILGL
jgi:hypothetical protein